MQEPKTATYLIQITELQRPKQLPEWLLIYHRAMRQLQADHERALYRIETHFLDDSNLDYTTELYHVTQALAALA